MGVSSQTGHENGKKQKASDAEGDAERGGLLSPEKAWEDHICVYKYLRGEVKKMESRYLTVIPSDRTKGHGHKLKQSQCYSGTDHVTLPNSQISEKT